MDHQRFDKLAKEFAGGSSRRGLLKRIAGIAVGAAAVAIPTKASAAIGDYCSSDYDCNSYNHEVCTYSQCVCKYGYKACDGKCIPEDHCCEECGYGETCQYGVCACDPTLGCCSADDCGYGETCQYGVCACDPTQGCCSADDCGYGEICQYGVCGCDPTHGCCSADDCGYGETCQYGVCIGGGYENTPPPVKKPAKQLNRTCHNNCLKAGRKSAKLKSARLTKGRVTRMRNSCKARCTK